MVFIEVGMIKITKLGLTNCGNEDWQYCIEYYDPPSFIESENTQTFFDIRKWCWETWGASKELPEWLNDDSPEATCRNEYWCWKLSDLNRRIYLRTDKELFMLKLRWA